MKNLKGRLRSLICPVIKKMPDTIGLICLCGSAFFIGHVSGVERTSFVCREVIEERQIIPCDTDTDCMLKNGGTGGYGE